MAPCNQDSSRCIHSRQEGVIKISAHDIIDPCDREALDLRLLKAETEKRQSFGCDDVAYIGPACPRVQAAYIPTYKFLLIHEM